MVAAATATIALPMNIDVSIVVAASISRQRGAFPAIAIAVAVVEHAHCQHWASPAVAVVVRAHQGRGPEGGVQPSGRMCSVLGTLLDSGQTRASCVSQL
jgi:hypothetical protein